MSREDEAIMQMKIEDDSDDNLVNVDGTKVKFSEKILKHAEEIKRKSMQLKIPKDILKSGKRRRAGTGRWWTILVPILWSFDLDPVPDIF